jgi:hypothetical protein
MRRSLSMLEAALMVVGCGVLGFVGLSVGVVLVIGIRTIKPRREMPAPK